MFLDKMMKIKEELMLTEKRQKHDVYGEFSKKKFNIISEIKKASPSKGNINLNADICKTAGEYLKNGASMLSVLTESEYFKGSVEDFKQIRSEFPNAILLRKDFIMDDFQVYESKIIGADVILIILAFTGIEKSKELIELAHNLGLEVLLEVHNEDEMKAALTLNTKFVGVNNRNLKTLQVSLDVARNLSKYITPDKIFVCESGLNSSEEISEMIRLGYNSFLIGSHFMKSENQGEALKEIISGIKTND
ncbi:indole-3-glycerol-phosphate synthase [bacterium]|nr:indole-3-glycerol-phosphate synthase [bacterium]